MDYAPLILGYAAIFVLGLCLGSFATALIYRIPRGISWIYDKKSEKKSACRSQCPQCHHYLGIPDLVPLFSYLLAGGKCRYCRKPISRSYPLTELLTAAALTGLFAAWGPVYAFLPLMLAVPFLVAGIVIDWEHMILPNDLNIALALLAAAFVILFAGSNAALFVSHVLGAVILPAFFWLASWAVGRLKRRQALGQGDLKFLPVAGLFLGIAALPTYMVAAGALGVLSTFVRAKTGVKTGSKGAFPFGPALILSLYLHLILTGLGFDYTW